MPARSQKLPPPSDESRYVFAALPRCPGCESTRLRAYRSRRERADDTVTRWCECGECGRRCIVVLE